jgi:alpha-glucosidase (family GH31 glycosyl hydrolase)
MNSADTWVDILPHEVDDMQGSYVNFVSEGGVLEFFVFASATHPQRVQKALADITGYTYLPAINVLGFHFSKWAPVSADMVRERSQNFTKFGFPVDVLWMDIEHALWTDRETVETRDYRWFTFNPYNYTADTLESLKAEIN